MYAKHLLLFLAAIGAVHADICEEKTVTINAPADTGQLSGCSTIAGSVVIDSKAAGKVDINGPKEIKGDLICADNADLGTLTSNSLRTIGGTFTLKNVTGLTTLSMTALESVNKIDWQSLSRLETVTFGSSGITKANDVTISDTFLAGIDGVNVSTIGNLKINNNRRLSKFSSKLQSLSDELIIQANGIGLKVDLPELTWIANMTVQNVSSISMPSLKVVNGSMRFDSNYFTNFSAPQMTNTEFGDVSFISNAELTSLNFPNLTRIAGGFTVANNTRLEKLNGFPELKTVSGAVKIRGSFTTVEMPALEDVKGAFDVASTGDITASCDVFKKLAPSNQGGSNNIQGTFSCESNNANANNDTSAAGGGSGGGGNDKGGAMALSFSMTLVVGLAAAGGIAQVLF